MKGIAFFIPGSGLLAARKDMKTDKRPPVSAITIADTSSIKLDENNYQDRDSLPLLQLIRTLCHWVEEKSKLGV